MDETTARREQPIADEYDVIVVGARAAGAATAMLLARRGLRVLAVDRSAYGSDTLSTHSLARPGVLQLSRWGVLDRIRAAGTPVASRVVFNYGRKAVVLDLPAKGDVDGLYSPRRTVLDAVLVDEAVAAGATVHHGIAVKGLVRDTTGRVCGVDLDDGGALRRVHARWVVGADGVRSLVARDVGAEVLHEESDAAGMIYGYWTGLRSDVIENHYEPGQAVGTIPTNGGTAVVWTGMARSRFDAEARGVLGDAYRRAIAEVPALADQLRSAQLVSGLRGTRGMNGFLRQPWGPGWALVGDAGYFKDPVSAHGITDAFIGAELLADALVSIVDHGRDENEALGEYQSARDELAAAMMPPVATVASFDRDLADVEQAFRDIAAAMQLEWKALLGREPAGRFKAAV